MKKGLKIIFAVVALLLVFVFIMAFRNKKAHEAQVAADIATIQQLAEKRGLIDPTVTAQKITRGKESPYHVTITCTGFSTTQTADSLRGFSRDVGRKKIDGSRACLDRIDVGKSAYTFWGDVVKYNGEEMGAKTDPAKTETAKTESAAARCKWPGCNADVFLPGYDYCVNHSCDNGTCKNPIAFEGVRYCTEHMAFLYDENLVNSNGKLVYKVHAKSNALHFTATFKGRGYFGITVKDENQNFYELVANEIGDYVVDKTVYVEKGHLYYIEAETTEGNYTIQWSGTYGPNPNG